MGIVEKTVDAKGPRWECIKAFSASVSAIQCCSSIGGFLLPMAASCRASARRSPFWIRQLPQNRQCAWSHFVLLPMRPWLPTTLRVLAWSALFSTLSVWCRRLRDDTWWACSSLEKLLPNGHVVFKCVDRLWSNRVWPIFECFGQIFQTPEAQAPQTQTRRREPDPLGPTLRGPFGATLLLDWASNVHSVVGLDSPGPPSAGPPSGGLPSARPPKISPFFSLSRTHFVLILSLWVSSSGILVVFEAPGA